MQNSLINIILINIISLVAGLIGRAEDQGG